MTTWYPPARRVDLVERLHGREVADPYRWLEDGDDPETGEWSKAQDELTGPWLEGLGDRDAIADRLRALLPGMVSAPAVRGGRMFVQRRTPEQEHAVVAVIETGERPDAGRVLIDPAALSPDATITLDAWHPSKEGRRLAYQLSDGGTEESSLLVLDVDTGAPVEGPIDRCRYSPVAWLPGGESYYYVRRLPPDAVPDGEAQYHRRVYLHRVGSDPAIDEEVFGAGRDKTAFYDLAVSIDGRWLIVSESLGTAPRNDVWIADLTSPDGHRTLIPVHEGVDAETYAHVAYDGRLYCHTTLGAPRWRLAVADPNRPQPEHWRDVVPQTDDVLEDWCVTDDAVVAVQGRHAVASVTMVDKDTGASLASVALPGLGSASVAGRPDGGSDVWIAYTDFVTPTDVWLHSTAPGHRADPPVRWATPPGDVRVTGIRTEQVTYASADGTPVRMFVIRPDDAQPDGERPTILYGYGGFNIAITPSYSSAIAAWVERGGIYVIANIRGGSEEGEQWHRDGMRDRKQNVFDDFVAAGERLIADGWTSPRRLGISGGSNGGLLMGAALTQRPDLWNAVVCSAPLLDMVRYEHFGLGQLWSDEYGSAAVAGELDWLLSYSPYHHVREGVAYPSVLFTVFESDTRVDPFHARKLCAALQWATSRSFDEAPILYRREENVGHSSRSVSRTLELSADTTAYFAARLSGVTGSLAGSG